MGKYEVTQAQLQAVMGENPSSFKYWRDHWDKPVECLSWEDCMKFLRRLNALPEVVASGLKFRLSTESGWECACRAGGKGDYCRLEDDAEIVESWLGKVTWHEPASGPHPVGRLAPNAFGLYDMLGNACEWCDEDGPGGDHVLRGGSWGDRARYCQSAGRCYYYAGYRSDFYRGFSLCCAARQ